MTATLNNDTDERHLTAHHEAGHAIAALMRGGGELVSITIDQNTATQRAGTPVLGYTHTRAKPCDTAFITYAGPWAEARTQWTEAPPTGA